MIEFMVEGEAVGKGRPKFTANGKYVQVYTPKKTRDYENEVCRCYLQKYKGGMRFSDMDALMLEMNIFVEPPKSCSKKMRQMMINGEVKPTKKPDIDNVLKAVQDALNKVAFPDDKQIVKVVVGKEYADIARVEIRIDKIENAKGVKG